MNLRVWMGFLILWGAPSATHTVRADQSAIADPVQSANAVDALAKRLDNTALSAIVDQPFANIALTANDARAASKLLWDLRKRELRVDRAEEMQALELALEELKMPFYMKAFGDKPAGKRSLFISMHGGGGAPKRVNDGQWKNQQRLYEPENGIYIAPRAPTDTWNLWHQPHIDRMFDRLIENAIVFEGVDPNRVYLLGYSAGGDGVYQLAPRMADRWAAAAMMAGHPNDASPLSLRNIGFAIYMGAEDAAYDRNKIAEQWKTRLADLAENDPDGYRHLVTIYEGKGHWMDREDAVALPWMSEFTREPFPKKIVWHKRDKTQERFYWVSVEPSVQAMITAAVEDQIITVEAAGVHKLTLRLNPVLLNLDKPIRVFSGEALVFEGLVQRTIAAMAESLLQRADPASIAHARLSITLHEESP